MGSLQLEISRGKNHLKIMIAKIALVSMLAAVALAAPEPQFPLGYGLGGGVVESVAPDCVPSTEEIEIQSCAPRAENVCSTADVVSEEITYEKRCKEVVNKHCGHLAHPGLIVKPEAEADAAVPLLHAGLPYAGHVGYAGIAPFAHHAVAIPAPVTKTIETPCTEVKTEHCVDVPITVEKVTPVETCHVVTKVDCTPAVHSIPKVTCAAGTATVVEHVGYAGYHYGK